MAAATYRAINSRLGIRPARDPQPSSRTEFILDTRKPETPDVIPFSESTRGNNGSLTVHRCCHLNTFIHSAVIISVIFRVEKWVTRFKKSISCNKDQRFRCCRLKLERHKFDYHSNWLRRDELTPVCIKHPHQWVFHSQSAGWADLAQAEW